MDALILHYSSKSILTTKRENGGYSKRVHVLSVLKVFRIKLFYFSSSTSAMKMRTMLEREPQFCRKTEVTIKTRIKTKHVHLTMFLALPYVLLD